MKFSLSWLKQHLDTTAPVESIATVLTNLGLEVESITNAGEALQPFCVGHVLNASKHPQADRLQVCEVDIGKDKPLQVVCGAPNARKGLKIAFAPIGTYIPGTKITLKPTAIRGVESQGMLCSGFELELDTESDGILELPEDAPVGQGLASYLQLDDPVFTLKITPNRSDCLGVRGIARDLAAAGWGKLKPLQVTKHASSHNGPLKITQQLSDQDAHACPHFLGRYIKGVRNKPSPAWLQSRLKSIGLRPISALVDITNYITFDLGRPLHVFDAQLVKDRHLIIRMAKDKESLLALDGKIHNLSTDMTVVADPDGPLAIGGIIGGQPSGCHEHTHEVILEAAYFDPIRIATTGRKLDVRTDSRYRLERGVDPQSTWLGVEMATQMILDICGGEVVQTVEVGQPVPEFKGMPYTPTLVEKMAGLEIKEDVQQKILSDLGFTVTVNAKGPWTVVPPTWRHDVTIPMDLVEEVLRVHGYQNIPTPTPHAVLTDHSPLPFAQQRVHQARYTLAHRGLQEAVTWSMISQPLVNLFGGAHDNLRISNPISLDLEYLRPSILPTLLLATQRNMERAQPDVHLFEVGPQYFGGKPGEQHTVAALIRTGVHHRSHWSHTDRPVDIYDVKADVLAILALYGIHGDQVQYQTQHLPEWYHPGRSASIQQGPKNRLALFGELHPAVAKQMGLKGRIMIAEIFLDKLPLKKVTKDTALHLTNYQPVERDFSFLVDLDLPADRILQAIKKKHRQLITAAHVFDVFQNESLKGKKALGIRVRLEPHLGTLTDEEIKAVSQDIVDAVVQLGGSLR